MKPHAAAADQEHPARNSSQPFRAELLGPERLSERARELAGSQAWTAERVSRSTPLVGLVEKAASQLAASNRTLAMAVRDRQPISPASEWLLDNYYLIEEQVQAVRLDLPVGYGAELPRLTAGELAGFPRVFQAVIDLVSHTDARIDEEYLDSFVGGFQDVSPFTIGELWAIPIMLRITAVENLARLSARVVDRHVSERAADSWADKLLMTAQDDPGALRPMIENLERDPRSASAAFDLRLSQRLQGREDGSASIHAWLGRRLEALGVSIDHLAHEQQQTQASDQVSIANTITAVRFLDAYNWDTFFERASFVEHILRRDPAGVYPRMDFKSRDRYRHAVEMMARRCPHDEIAVAEAVLSLSLEALTANPSDPTAGHVGYHLIQAGRYDLERSVDYRPLPRERLYRGPLARHGRFYWGTLGCSLIAMVALLAYTAHLIGASPLGVLAIAVLTVIPMSDLAVAITNRIAARVFPPRILPKLDFHEPISAAHSTLVVVPTLLSSVQAARNVIDNLEIAYLANTDSNIDFALLGDLKSAPDQHHPGDEAVIDTAISGIEHLNERYESEHGRRPFGLFIRGRRHDPGEGVWMGWERKRGALIELCQALRGGTETGFTHRVGRPSRHTSYTFVITLDADTVLPRDGARKLIACIAHPLNRAKLCPDDPRVLSGYGLVQPRVSMSLPGSSKSLFARLFSGITGIDPYAGAVSDTYQDVFGEGSFTGKGIFEINVFNAILQDRFPENSLLSHDLLEGSFLRTALASDIEVFDEYPASYASHAARLHRWVRGDWQTLPWLQLRVPDATGRRVANPLSLLHRWKVIDNLRRSLVAPALLVLMSVGWRLLPGTAWAWPVMMTLIVLFPAYLGLSESIFAQPHAAGLSIHLRTALSDFRRDALTALLSLTLLPHHAWMMTDAILRSLWRMAFSHRRMLEWETAADADRRLGTARAGFVRRMWPSSAVAIALTLVGAGLDPHRIALASPLLLLWGLAPVVAWRISLPLGDPKEQLDREGRRTARTIARRTWRFFETFVTAEGHWLAPDNYQEDPKDEVAWRSSPTNFGLHLLCNLSAYDLGFIPVTGLVERTARTLSSMAGLQRFRGHFYNWYDIQTLEPLPPKYISTVDSGNLAGHLLVLRLGLLEASEAPFLGPQLIDGIGDCARLALEDLFADRDDSLIKLSDHRLRETLEEIERATELHTPPEDLGEWYEILDHLSDLARSARAVFAGLSQSSAAAIPYGPVSARSHLREALDDLVASVEESLSALNRHASWAPLIASAPSAVMEDTRARDLEPITGHVPSLVGLAEGLDGVLAALHSIADEPPGDGAARAEAVSWARAVADGILAERQECIESLARLRLDAAMAREMWEHTDFKMLFDEGRLLFSIGYNTAEGHLDGSYYDMLASECRLASFLAIAKGDVPQEHWFRLGRGVTQTRRGRALLSWSASMFEYMMPLLVMKSWPRTLLHETYSAVVDRQVEYGRELGVPWGVSESAFNAKDSQLTYQYQAFGVPGLGLKRGLSDDIVIAPYACILAMPLAPGPVLDNLRELARQGLEGRYGFYESVDYTPGRIPAGKMRGIVKAHFAHHQGMSLVALANELTEGRMRERFHSDPMVASAELLLQERMPRNVQETQPNIEEVEHVRSVRELPPPVARSYPLADTPVPATHFLSNGRYSVMITNGGGGYSRWASKAITRYREDVTRDCWGTFIFIRDVDSDRFWPVTANPGGVVPDEYHVTFAPDKAEFRRTDGALETHTEIAVSPEEDVEVRRVILTNRGENDVTLEITSYFEIALSDQGADQAHRSFSNLFVETEALPEFDSVLFSRRPRSAEESRIWGFHTMACEATEKCVASFETDRARFLGRHRGASAPAAVVAGGDLSNTVGPVLDPSCSIRMLITIPAGGSARAAFTTGVATERHDAVRLAEGFHDIRSAQRAIDLAWMAAQIELRDLGIKPEDAVLLERLASRLLLTDPYSPLKMKTPQESGLGISGLWSLGISGDWPILLVRVDELEHAPLVRHALLAHQYWRHKGLVSDLVILNVRPTAYSDELDERLRLLVRTGHALQLQDKPGGVFLRRVDQMHPDVLSLLESVARATLDGSSGSIDIQLNRRGVHPAPPDPLVARVKPVARTKPASPRPALLNDNGYGGFDLEHDEYVIILDADHPTTPAPWVNVMATPSFGALVSEAGVGCTWAKNSHENRITTWNNDPVSDGSGESLYVRDEETGEFWSPTPLPVRGPEPYVVRHGKGYSRFEHESHGIRHELDWFVADSEPVRVVRLSLVNLDDRPRRLSVTQFIEWVLGSSRSAAQQSVATWFDSELEMLTAHNYFNMDFPGRTAFLACDAPLHSWTASRTEFIGRNRGPADPAAMHRKSLGGVSGRYHDNCAALMTTVDLAPGESSSVTFLLGQTDDLDGARDIVLRCRGNGAIDKLFAEVREHWRSLLECVQVSTPDTSLDLLVNGQLLYQTLACRLWGRTAMYQSSGAYGFRDQLQDTLSLLHCRPDLVREQIVEASRHQFAEGDVLHWWQPHSGRGVRTRISDDRHWLPLVVAEYVSATGDDSVLHEKTPFIEGPEVEPDREDAYLEPAISETSVTIYEHCIRAIETARKVGPHGLPLIGGGDWNDGMNRVGHNGEGESVWLAWFLDVVLKRFASVCALMQDEERADEYRAWADTLVSAVENEAWDGRWYRRAYFDDGTPLGSSHAEECQIDAIAQAWATISGSGDPERARRALGSVTDRLVHRDAGLIALLAPPFDHMEHDPGYIKGYVPGVRENGGQYTHAAIWVCMAHLLQGDGDEALSLLDMINPLNHASTQEDADIYKVEPYVVAADVYAVPPHVGRGGWTWYTGSSSWFYRVVVNNLLGLSRIHVDGEPHLEFNPCIPKRWAHYEMTYRSNGTEYAIRIENPRGVNRGVAHVVMDGVRTESNRVPLYDDGVAHEVIVTLLGG